ncbi:MAG TPA: ribulose-phosphate 3-epimerase [Firmicutes bacterium]|nr:ribulose-phosphate 3-epimerase [Bacillota bacterium]
MRIKVGASLDCADYGNLQSEVEKLERGGADLLHCDVMDGHFVPNFAIGTRLIRTLREKTRLIFDIHLAIEEPEHHIERFLEAGGDIITVHVEACHRLHQIVRHIRKCGGKACVAYAPSTPVSGIEYILPEIDMVLLMTVDPGFPGQRFVPGVIHKVEHVRRMIEHEGLDVDIEVDGGINEETIPLLYKAGANVFVAGTSSVFNGREDTETGMRKFKAFCEGLEKCRNL